LRKLILDTSSIDLLIQEKLPIKWKKYWQALKRNKIEDRDEGDTIRRGVNKYTILGNLSVSKLVLSFKGVIPNT